MIDVCPKVRCHCGASTATRKPTMIEVEVVEDAGL